LEITVQSAFRAAQFIDFTPVFLKKLSTSNSYFQLFDMNCSFLFR